MATTPSPPGLYLTGTALSTQITRNDTGDTIVLDGFRTRFNVENVDTMLKSDVIDNGGRVVNKRIPDGIKGSIEVERGSADFATFMAFLDANYYAGEQDIYCTITTTEPSADKTDISEFQHTYCVFNNYKPGTWSRKEILKATVEFEGTERINVS
jgi:hypothetical protein